MAKKKKKVCGACKGKGYLVTAAFNILKTLHGHVPSFYEVPESVPEIQRCDACEMLLNDNMAQNYFLDDVKKGRTILPRLLLLWGPDEESSRRTNG